MIPPFFIIVQFPLTSSLFDHLLPLFAQLRGRHFSCTIIIFINVCIWLFHPHLPTCRIQLSAVQPIIPLHWWSHCDFAQLFLAQFPDDDYNSDRLVNCWLEPKVKKNNENDRWYDVLPEEWFCVNNWKISSNTQRDEIESRGRGSVKKKIKRKRSSSSERQNHVLLHLPSRNRTEQQPFAHNLNIWALLFTVCLHRPDEAE